jgi:hypothetical protein
MTVGGNVTTNTLEVKATTASRNTGKTTAETLARMTVKTIDAQTVEIFAPPTVVTVGPLIMKTIAVRGEISRCESLETCCGSFSGASTWDWDGG